MKKFFAGLLVMLMVFNLAACGSSPSADETKKSESTAVESGEADGDVFKIYTYLQLTGPDSVSGVVAKNSIDLAVDYINANGGMNGAKVEVEHYDTTGSPEEAVKIVQKIMTQDVDAVVGSVISGEVAACIPYLNDAKIYNFGLGTSATWMEDDSMIYTFRASCNNARCVPQDIDLIEQLGYKKIAVMSSTDDSGRISADTFVELCKERGLTVTTRQECDPSDTDYAGQISKLLESDPDIIFMSLLGPVFGPFTKQVRNMGYKGMLCSTQSFSEDVQQIAGMAPNTDYVFVAYPFVTYRNLEDVTIPVLKDYCEMYQDKYGEMPPHETAFRAWDTMMVMWEASKIAGANDSDSLREATNKVVIEGLGGTLDYTNGDREGYSSFNSFILKDNQNILFSDWLDNGGYDEYLETTGRDR